MFKRMLKLLVLLATLQFANASDNMKQFEQLAKQYKKLNVNVRVENVNIYKENQGNIFSSSNNNNSIDIACDIPSMGELQSPFYYLNDIIQMYYNQKSYNNDTKEAYRTNK